MEPTTRLEEALSIFLAWQESEPRCPAAELLDQHAELAEYLRPMIEDSGEEPSSDERYLGEYRVGKELGRGGMGVVYEAWQSSLGRSVALKVLAPHLTHNPTTLARFRREAMTAARLQHVGLVGVLGFGSEEDTHFLAMDIVRGAPLDRVLDALRPTPARELNGQRFAKAVSECIAVIHGEAKDGSVSDTDSASPAMTWSGGYVQTVASIALQVAETLDYAHREGVVHRDIKPSNILIREDGRAALTDFGLAREEGLPALTMTGEFAGSPYYVSPEQAMGRRSGLDRRTDVFSLGTTLYELLTFTRPFEGATAHEIMGRILHREAVDPEKLNPALAPDLAAVVLKALEKNPDRRYQTAGELAADLRAFLEYRPVQARRPSAIARVGRWVRREPLKAGMVSAFAVVALLGTYLLSTQEATAAGREVILQEEIDALLKEGFLSVMMRIPPQHSSRPFDDVLEVDPGNPYGIVGKLDFEYRGDPQAQLDFLRSARRTGRGERALLRREVTALVDLGREEEARLLRERLDEPRDSLDFFADGMTYLSRTGMPSPDQMQEAVALFESAIYRAPTPNFIFYLQLATAASRAGDSETAVRCAGAVIELWPELPEAWWVAAVAVGLYEPQKAIEYFRRVVELNPHPALLMLTHRNLALSLSTSGDLDGAIESIRKAIAMDDRSGSSHSILAMYLGRKAEAAEAEGDEDAARSWWEQALAASQQAVDLNPTYVQFLAQLAHDLERTGDVEGAYRVSLESIRLEPRFPTGHRNVVGMSRVRGDMAGMRAERERWAELHPSGPTAQRELADFLLGQGEGEADLQRALDKARLAVQLSEGQDPYCLVTAARAEQRVGDRPAALELLTRAEGVLPEGAEARSALLEQIAEIRKDL